MSANDYNFKKSFNILAKTGTYFLSTNVLTRLVHIISKHGLMMFIACN